MTRVKLSTPDFDPFAELLSFHSFFYALININIEINQILTYSACEDISGSLLLIFYI